MVSKDTTRQAKHRAKRKAEGWTILHVQLPPDVTKCLAGITSKGQTKQDAVCDAIQWYDKGFR